MSTGWDVYTCERCGKPFVNDRGRQSRHCVGCALQVAAELTRRGGSGDASSSPSGVMAASNGTSRGGLAGLWQAIHRRLSRTTGAVR